MTADHGTSGIPVARPVEARAYGADPHVEDGGTRWYRDGERWLRAGSAGAFVLAWALTDVGPAVLVALAVVAGAQAVHRRRLGTRWWTVLELVLYVALVVGVLVLTRQPRELGAAVLAVQLVVGALAGAGLVALTVALRRRRAAPAAPPTAG